MNRRQIIKLLGTLAACGVSSIGSASPISINTNSFTYSQNFDTLPTNGSTAWSNSTTIPGWVGYQSLPGGTAVAGGRDTAGAGGFNGETTIPSNAGGTATAALYNFGTANTTDRALGSIGSASTGDFFFGVEFSNDTGSVVNSITVGYTGEEWRGTNNPAQSILFDYSVTASSMWDNASFANQASLNFTAPQAPAGARAYNGNASGDFTVFSPVTISGLNLRPGATLRLRWWNDSANTYGLAVDDFAFTATATPAPEPASIALLALAGAGLGARRRG